MNMKNIYILNEYSGSKENGIGTFLQELLVCFENENVCLIEFNSIESDFCIKSGNKIREIHFPPFLKNGFLANYKIIDKFFRLYIEDSPDNLFMINHSPCEKLMRLIKESFPLSKITFIIHNQGWASRLSGNLELLKKILWKESEKKIKSKYQNVLDYFHEEQQMYEIADKVICLSEDTYCLLQELYKVRKDKICLIPNGLKDSFKRISIEKKKNEKMKMGIPVDEKVILFVGRVGKTKGINELLSSLGKICRRYTACRLVIIGSLSNSGLLNLTKKYAAKVTYTGLMSKNEIRKWYKIADLGIISSYSEQCSYSGIEMMMYGLSIVASDAFGVRTMFKDGINARIAKIGNREKPAEYINNLANAVIELLLSEDLCKKLSQGAREMYKSCYTPKKMRRGYTNLLHVLSTG